MLDQFKEGKNRTRIRKQSTDGIHKNTQQDCAQSKEQTISVIILMHEQTKHSDEKTKKVRLDLR